VYAWVLSRYSDFLPQSKNMHVRLIGVSKIVLRSECEHACGCLSLCDPVMDWRWDRLQPPCDQTDGLDGWMEL